MTHIAMLCQTDFMKGQLH